MDKFAKMAGYKGVTVASTTWSRVKRNLQKIVPVTEPEENGDGEEAKDSGIKRKRGAKKAGGDESAGEAAAPKKRGRGKQAQKDAGAGDGDGPGTEPVTPKASKSAGKKTIAGGNDVDGGPGSASATDPATFTPINEITPEDDGPATLGCITVKCSEDDEATPAAKKRGRPAQKAKGNPAARKFLPKPNFGTGVQHKVPKKETDDAGDDV